MTVAILTTLIQELYYPSGVNIDNDILVVMTDTMMEKLTMDVTIILAGKGIREQRNTIPGISNKLNSLEFTAPSIGNIRVVQGDHLYIKILS